MATTTKTRKRNRRTRSPEELEQKRAERAEKVAGLLSDVADKAEQLTTSEGWLAMLRTASRFHHYSLNNQILIACQGFERGFIPTRVAGYRTWQSLGRQVRKGEKGLAILAPVTVKTEETDEQTGQTEESRRLVAFKPEHVWDISQTDGEDLPEVAPQLLAGQAPEGAVEGVTAQITAAGYAVAYTEPARGEGSANPLTKTITVRPDVDEAEQLSTLLHELAHVLLGHADDVVGYHRHRGRAEIEAESVAYVVLGALGVDTSDYTVPYLTGWAGSEPEQVRQAAATVTHAAHQILDALDHDSEPAQR